MDGESVRVELVHDAGDFSEGVLLTDQLRTVRLATFEKFFDF